jgi:lipopolysaccharide export system permease protein
VIETAHSRIQFPILCLVSSLIGFAALYAAGFSRFGSGRFIALAIFLLVIIKLVEGAVTEPTRNNIEYWPLVYAPSIVGLSMFWGLMYLSINPNLLRRKNQLAGQSS